MKAFLSYSIQDSDQILITLLSRRLREKGFHVMTSQNFFNEDLDFTTKNEIDRANLFIGMISKATGYRDRVIQEWEHAKATGTPTILLVENGVRINPEFKDDYVRFDRTNPQKAIDEINKRMEEPKDSASAWPWIIGGAIVLGIMQLFASDKD